MSDVLSQVMDLAKSARTHALPATITLDVDSSSSVSRVEYDTRTSEMTVTYKSGGQYIYSNVESWNMEDLVREVCRGGSVGKYIAYHIKPKHYNHPYRKVAPPEEVMS
jgi:anti-sigma-K factor RskA